MEVVRTLDAAFADLPGFPYEPLYLDALPGFEGLRLAYIDEGPRDGDVFLCLHGQPTWSYLYRKMMPRFLARGMRVVAPDFFGFGRSDKPVDESVYSFAFHRQTLMRFIEVLDVSRFTLVCQDWGGILGLTLPLDMPERIAGVLAMNTAIATGKEPPGPGFVAWLAYSNAHPDLDVARLLQRAVPHLSESEAQAYAAPYPDARAKAGVRRFPQLVPLDSDADGAALGRAACAWWSTQWNGPSFLAVGVRDPVLGVDAMEALRATIRHAPPVMRVEEGGHFLQEWGETVADAALERLTPK